MAVKTFSTGEILTASDTNTYLNNGGLVYITGVSLSGNTANIDNCFSSTYDNYLIVMNVTSANNDNAITAQLRTGSGNEALSSYYWGGYYITYGGNTLTGEGGTGTTTSWRVGECNTQGGVMEMSVFMPNDSVYTYYISHHLNAATFIRHHTGFKATTTQYTGIGFTFAGTTWAGAIRVYGRREA